MPPKGSGIYVEGEVRDASLFPSPSGQRLLVSRNNAAVLIFRKK
jgi:hypothetical protein